MQSYSNSFKARGWQVRHPSQPAAVASCFTRNTFAWARAGPLGVGGSQSPRLPRRASPATAGPLHLRQRPRWCPRRCITLQGTLPGFWEAPSASCRVASPTVACMSTHAQPLEIPVRVRKEHGRRASQLISQLCYQKRGRGLKEEASQPSASSHSDRDLPQPHHRSQRSKRKFISH